jgi:cytoskeleton protein RodZ
MPTVAEQLRQAREAQGLNIHQVAEITKIKTDHVRALEEGDYDRFVAPVYIRGFVRTYAKVLKLDEAGIAADLEKELSRTEKFKEPPPLTTRPRTPLDFVMLQVSRLNWRILVAALVLVIVVVLALVSFRGRGQKDDPLKKLGPGLYQPKPEQSGETLPVPTTPPRRP